MRSLATALMLSIDRLPPTMIGNFASIHDNGMHMTCPHQPGIPVAPIPFEPLG
jgi:hypothetical protein